MTVTTYSNAMQMDVNPAVEVYIILRETPHPSCHFDTPPLVISSVTPFVISSVVEKSHKQTQQACNLHLSMIHGKRFWFLFCCS